jgi:WbqC-like protein family
MLEARRMVAIHQPNFFPWLGYFNKIARSDVFIVLDNVQFSKKGGTWSNRVRILLGGRPIWITLPVERSFHGVRLVREMRIADGPWRVRLLRTVRGAYRPAPCFDEVFPVVEELLETPTDMVAELNLTVVRALTSRLGLDPDKLIVASTLGVDGAGTDLLINAVRAVCGGRYLCGGGAQGYQDDERFGPAGIELVQQTFRHPVYPQLGVAEFVPGLSIIDALMNCGFVATRKLIAGADVESEGHSENAAGKWCR